MSTMKKGLNGLVNTWSALVSGRGYGFDKSNRQRRLNGQLRGEKMMSGSRGFSTTAEPSQIPPNNDFAPRRQKRNDLH